LEKQEEPSEYEYAVWYYLPDRQNLLGLLVNGDRQRFVDCLLGHFEAFAQFIPVLDEIFPEQARRDLRTLPQLPNPNPSHARPP
jgi:hypothetical protein